MQDEVQMSRGKRAWVWLVGVLLACGAAFAAGVWVNTSAQRSGAVGAVMGAGQVLVTPVSQLGTVTQAVPEVQNLDGLTRVGADVAAGSKRGSAHTSVDGVVHDSGRAVVTALFSPDEQIQKTLVATIEHAQRSILVQAYLLTDDAISRALVAAHRRGVNVSVLLDARMAGDAKGSDALALFEAGIPVFLETQYDNAHNKVMIFDHDTAQAVLVTGSYNFTYSAQFRNAENVVLIRQAPELVRRFVENWRKHAAQAVPYSGHLIS